MNRFFRFRPSDYSALALFAVAYLFVLGLVIAPDHMLATFFAAEQSH